MPVENPEWDEDGVLHAPDSPSVAADTLGPPPSSIAPGESAEPHRVDDETDEPEPLPEFDPRYKQDFEGLLYLGRLTDTFTWLGHTFTIRTLTSGEVMEVGLLHKPYVGTLADVKAYQAAVVAACVLEVDHKPMPVPVTNDPSDTALVGKFQYVMQSWFPPTLDVVYDRYMLLEERVERVIEAMGKASGLTGSTPTSNATSV